MHIQLRMLLKLHMPMLMNMHMSMTRPCTRTWTCPRRHTFNFLKADQWVYLVVADEAFGRQVRGSCC